MQETKPIRWYACRKDALIIAFVIGLSFWINPIRLIYAKFKIHDDMGLLAILIEMAIMLPVAILICRSHFWSWNAIGFLGLRTANIAKDTINSPRITDTFKTFLDESIINAMFDFAFSIPMLAIVYWMRKKWRKD